MQNIFFFDIETIPDVDCGRRLSGLDGLDDAATGASGVVLRNPWRILNMISV
jgi:predicted PolB exonuclease-like 3'-5' exonuclease